MIHEPDSLMNAEPFTNIVGLYKADNKLKEVCRILKIDFIEAE